jgi:hypothetical protein
VLITGVMAAGKSTVSQLLAERFDRSVHLRGDRFRRMIVRGNAAPNTDAFEAELRLRYALAARSADGYAAAGYAVVWQDCVIGAVLGDIDAMVTARPLDIVVLAPRPEIVASRDAHRHKRGYDGEWTVDQLDRILRDETPHIGTWIDNSDQTPDETVDQIIATIT